MRGGESNGLSFSHIQVLVFQFLAVPFPQHCQHAHQDHELFTCLKNNFGRYEDGKGRKKKITQQQQQTNKQTNKNKTTLYWDAAHIWKAEICKNSKMKKLVKYCTASPLVIERERERETWDAIPSRVQKKGYNIKEKTSISLLLAQIPSCILLGHNIAKSFDIYPVPSVWISGFPSL